MEALSPTVSYLPGVDVSRFEMQAAHTVAIKWYVELGPWMETPPLSGASHLLEHLLFMQLSPPGMPVIHTWVSDVEAATGIDSMIFSAVTTPEHLDAVLERLCLLYRLSPAALQAELPRARRHVLHEFTNVENDAESECDLAFIKLLWGDRWLEVEPLGSRQSVRGLTAASLHPFYEARFRAVHTHLVLAGPPGLQVPPLNLPGGPAAVSPRRAPPPLPDNLKLRTIYEDAPESYLLMAFPIAITTELEDAAGDLLSTLLTGCEFIGLYKSMIDEAVLAYDIQSDWTVHHGQACFIVSGWIPHRNLPRALEMIFSELRRMAEQVGEEGFEVGRAQLRIGLLSSLEGPRRLLGLYDDLRSSGFTVPQALDALRRVTPEHVQKLARRLFIETPPVVVVHGPGKRRQIERWLKQA